MFQLLVLRRLVDFLHAAQGFRQPLFGVGALDTGVANGLDLLDRFAQLRRAAIDLTGWIDSPAPAPAAGPGLPARAPPGHPPDDRIVQITQIRRISSSDMAVLLT